MNHLAHDDAKCDHTIVEGNKIKNSFLAKSFQKNKNMTPYIYIYIYKTISSRQ